MTDWMHWAAGFAAGAVVVIIGRALFAKRGLKSEVRKMKWISRRDWFLDTDHEYRLINVGVVLVSAALITAVWLFMFATSLHPLNAAALSLLISGILMAFTVLVMFALKEEL